MIKTNKKTTKSNSTHKQLNNPKADEILLGLDLHTKDIVLSRQVDRSNPQPAQRFKWEQIEAYCSKQLELGKKVYAIYEAGAFGFGLCRRLRALGVQCLIMHPIKLDPRNKRVQTDKTDARELVGLLRRYVDGNTRVISVVQVPTEEQEARRCQSRHRKYLQKEMMSLAAHGRGVLLTQGFRSVGKWWTAPIWEVLAPKLSVEVRESLEDCRKLIEQYEILLRPLERKLVASAPAQLPIGAGSLSWVLMMREIYNWDRFKNRRKVGGFMGLGGGVSSSSTAHYELSITKAGSPYLRTLLIEMAWRMVRFQPRYRAVQKWQHILGDKKTHRSRRKRAIVALSRQLAVDLWKWQTGRTTPEELGWDMLESRN